MINSIQDLKTDWIHKFLGNFLNEIFFLSVLALERLTNENHAKYNRRIYDSWFGEQWRPWSVTSFYKVQIKMREVMMKYLMINPVDKKSI